MQVVDALGDVEGELLAVVPRHLYLHVVEQAPKRASGAVFEHDAKVGLLGARAKEQDDVGVSDDLHDSALVLELLKLVLLNDLALDLFDGHHGVLPAAAIDDAVATLGQLSVVAQFIESDLIVLNECARFIRDVIIAAVVLLLQQCLLELALEVARIGTGLLELGKDLPLVR